ncbi:Breast cancer 2, early onset [Gaertneriomyces sp. JEL0708]|nr:Breast cancer 2, early onset [Gaertneriomyces sp. JEL0708]
MTRRTTPVTKTPLQMRQNLQHLRPHQLPFGASRRINSPTHPLDSIWSPSLETPSPGLEKRKETPGAVMNRLRENLAVPAGGGTPTAGRSPLSAPPLHLANAGLIRRLTGQLSDRLIEESHVADDSSVWDSKPVHEITALTRKASALQQRHARSASTISSSNDDGNIFLEPTVLEDISDALQGISKTSLRRGEDAAEGTPMRPGFRGNLAKSTPARPKRRLLRCVNASRTSSAIGSSDSDGSRPSPELKRRKRSPTPVLDVMSQTPVQQSPKKQHRPSVTRRKGNLLLMSGAISTNNTPSKTPRMRTEKRQRSFVSTDDDSTPAGFSLMTDLRSQRPTIDRPPLRRCEQVTDFSDFPCIDAMTVPGKRSISGNMGSPNPQKKRLRRRAESVVRNTAVNSVADTNGRMTRARSRQLQSQSGLEIRTQASSDADGDVSTSSTTRSGRRRIRQVADSSQATLTPPRPNDRDITADFDTLFGSPTSPLSSVSSSYLNESDRETPLSNTDENESPRLDRAPSFQQSCSAQLRLPKMSAVATCNSPLEHADAPETSPDDEDIFDNRVSNEITGSQDLIPDTGAMGRSQFVSMTAVAPNTYDSDDSDATCIDDKHATASTAQPFHARAKASAKQDLQETIMCQSALVRTRIDKGTVASITASVDKDVTGARNIARELLGALPDSQESNASVDLFRRALGVCRTDSHQNGRDSSEAGSSSESRNVDCCPEALDTLNAQADSNHEDDGMCDLKLVSSPSIQIGNSALQVMCPGGAEDFVNAGGDKVEAIIDNEGLKRNNWSDHRQAVSESQQEGDGEKLSQELFACGVRPESPPSLQSTLEQEAHPLEPSPFTREAEVESDAHLLPDYQDADIIPCAGAFSKAPDAPIGHDASSDTQLFTAGAEGNFATEMSSIFCHMSHSTFLRSSSNSSQSTVPTIPVPNSGLEQDLSGDSKLSADADVKQLRISGSSQRTVSTLKLSNLSAVADGGTPLTNPHRNTEVVDESVLAHIDDIDQPRTAWATEPCQRNRQNASLGTLNGCLDFHATSLSSQSIVDAPVPTWKAERSETRWGTAPEEDYGVTYDESLLDQVHCLTQGYIKSPSRVKMEHDLECSVDGQQVASSRLSNLTDSQYGYDCTQEITSSMLLVLDKNVSSNTVSPAAGACNQEAVEGVPIFHTASEKPIPAPCADHAYDFLNSWNANPLEELGWSRDHKSLAQLRATSVSHKLGDRRTIPQHRNLESSNDAYLLPGLTATLEQIVERHEPAMPTDCLQQHLFDREVPTRDHLVHGSDLRPTFALPPARVIESEVRDCTVANQKTDEPKVPLDSHANSVLIGQQGTAASLDTSRRVSCGHGVASLNVTCPDQEAEYDFSNVLDGKSADVHASEDFDKSVVAQRNALDHVRPSRNESPASLIKEKGQIFSRDGVDEERLKKEQYTYPRELTDAPESCGAMPLAVPSEVAIEVPQAVDDEMISEPVSTEVEMASNRCYIPALQNGFATASGKSLDPIPATSWETAAALFSNVSVNVSSESADYSHPLGGVLDYDDRGIILPQCTGSRETAWEDCRSSGDALTILSGKYRRLSLEHDGDIRLYAIPALVDRNARLTEPVAAGTFTKASGKPLAMPSKQVQEQAAALLADSPSVCPKFAFSSDFQLGCAPATSSSECVSDEALAAAPQEYLDGAAGSRSPKPEECEPDTIPIENKDLTVRGSGNTVPGPTEDAVEEAAVLTHSLSSACGFTTGTGKSLSPLSKEALEVARKSILTASYEMDHHPTNVNDKFSTGTGRALQPISDGAHSEAQRLFDGGSTASGFSTGGGNALRPIPSTAFHQARILVEGRSSVLDSKGSPKHMRYTESTLSGKIVPQNSQTFSKNVLTDALPHEKDALFTPVRSKTGHRSKKHPKSAPNTQFGKPYRSPLTARSFVPGTPSPSFTKNLLNFRDATTPTGRRKPFRRNLLQVSPDRRQGILSSHRQEQAHPIQLRRTVLFDLSTDVPRQTMRHCFGHTRYAWRLNDDGDGVPEYVQSIDSCTATTFAFVKNGSSWGATEAREDLVALGANGSLANELWVHNHYRWIVWKLASMVRTYPQLLDEYWSPAKVLTQLRYRYEREINLAQRSAVKMIVERDNVPHWFMILCVSRLGTTADVNTQTSKLDPSVGKQDETSPTCSWNLELTDGWYAIKARVDKPLLDVIRKGRIRPGMKLRIAGAQLAPSGEACAVLEATDAVQLLLHINGTRHALWDACLGYQIEPCFTLGLNQLVVNGGVVPCVDVIICRQYEVKFLEKMQDGPGIVRSRREEDIAVKEWEERYSAIYERTLNEVVRESTSANATTFRKGLIDIFDGELTDASDLAEAIQDAVDPSSLLDRLRPEQRDAVESRLQNSRRKHHEELMREARDRVEEKMPQRQVSRFISFLVCDYPPVGVATDCTTHALLTVWNPDEVLLETLEEGKRFKLCNVTTKAHDRTSRSHIELISQRNTRYIEMPVADDRLQNTHYRSRQTLSADFLDQCKRNDEIDIVLITLNSYPIHETGVGATGTRYTRSIICTDASLRLVAVELQSRYRTLIEFAPRSLIVCRNLRYIYYDRALGVHRLRGTNDSDIRQTARGCNEREIKEKLHAWCSSHIETISQLIDKTAVTGGVAPSSDRHGRYIGENTTALTKVRPFTPISPGRVATSGRTITTILPVFRWSQLKRRPVEKSALRPERSYDLLLAKRRVEELHGQLTTQALTNYNDARLKLITMELDIDGCIRQVGIQKYLFSALFRQMLLQADEDTTSLRTILHSLTSVEANIDDLQPLIFQEFAAVRRQSLHCTDITGMSEDTVIKIILDILVSARVFDDAALGIRFSEWLTDAEGPAPSLRDAPDDVVIAFTQHCSVMPGNLKSQPSYGLPFHVQEWESFLVRVFSVVSAVTIQLELVSATTAHGAEEIIVRNAVPLDMSGFDLDQSQDSPSLKV